MEKIDSYIEYVKSQIDFQLRMAKKYSSDVYREGLHHKNANTLQGMLAYFEELNNSVAGNTSDNGPKVVDSRRKILLSLEDIKDLPREVLEELNLTEADKQERQGILSPSN